MNWKLGFFRIWIVASICWLAFVGFAFYSYEISPRQLAATQAACAEARQANPALGNVFDCFEKGGPLFADLIPLKGVLPTWLVLAFVPLFAVLLLGFAIAWISAGFKRRRT